MRINHNDTETPLESEVLIISPVRNEANRISEMISSIRSQSYSNWRLLIYDNGSTDGTSEIVKNFIVEDSRISTYKNGVIVNAAENIHRSLEFGLKNFNSKAVFVIGGDDECGNNRFLEISMRHLEAGASLVVPSYQMFDANDSELSITKYNGKALIFSRFNFVNRIAHSIYPELGNMVYAVYDWRLLSNVVSSPRGRLVGNQNRRNNLNFISDWWFIDTSLRVSRGDVVGCEDIVYRKYMKNIAYSNTYYFPGENSGKLPISIQSKIKLQVYLENLIMFPFQTIYFERKRLSFLELPFMTFQVMCMVGSRCFIAFSTLINPGRKT